MENFRAGLRNSRSNMLEEVKVAFSKYLPPVLLLLIAVLCLQPFVPKLSWMVFVQDDFFYYLKVAQNLAHGHGSTFNGLVTTNGYHPLWLCILTIFSCFTTSPKAILALVAASSFIASVVTFFCSRRLFDVTGVGGFVSTVLAAMVTLYSLRLFFYGMEVTLAIPLVFCVLCVLQRPESILAGWKQSLGFGVLVSLMILARLDTIFLAGLIFLFALVQGGWKGKIKAAHLFGVGLGLTPLVIYFLINHHYFGVWLPVSGMAKQLKSDYLLSANTWRGLYLTTPSFLAVFLPIPLGILLYPFVARKVSPVNRVIYPAALFFPLVYFLFYVAEAIGVSGPGICMRSGRRCV